MEEEKERKLICDRCKLPLETVKTEFKYLGSVFHADLPVCKNCGQVYVPYELAKDRIREVETQLEDK
jgi:RNase P subunit RPR2